jgi:hypothetical protein
VRVAAGRRERVARLEVVKLTRGAIPMTARTWIRMTDRTMIQITINGEAFAIEQRRYTAAHLLALAGLPTFGHDLTRIYGPGWVETFQGSEVVDVEDGDVFVTTARRRPVA